MPHWLTKPDSVEATISPSLGVTYQPRSGLGKSAELLVKVAEVVGPDVTTVVVSAGVVVVVVGVVVVVVGVVVVVVVGVVVVVVVVVGVVVLAAAVTSLQQTFSAPGAGSPKLALLHSTPFANDFTTALVVVPYLTLRVPLNVQMPYSFAHSAQAWLVEVVEPAPLTGFVEADGAGAWVPTDASVELPLPPPQAERAMEAAAMICASKAREVVEGEVTGRLSFMVIRYGSLAQVPGGPGT